jgi:hypothetical protein
MRILLDECVPRPLRRELPNHEVRTVPAMGWAGKKNGELLRLIIAEGFTVFLTADQNLRYQQNLRSAGIAVVVLVAKTNRLIDLQPLMGDTRAAIEYIQPGEFIEISASDK